MFLACGIKCKQNTVNDLLTQIKPGAHPSLLMHDTMINETTKHKHFGQADDLWKNVYFICLPLLEYSDSVWDNCSTESKNKFESIHIEAARVVTGATKLCSIEKNFADLGWESFQNRRNKHKLVILYKILHGIAPKYLSDIAPSLIQSYQN